jgi:hypothetical protein
LVTFFFVLWVASLSFVFFFFTLKIPHWSFVFQRGRFICEPCRLWQGNFLFSFVFFFFHRGLRQDAHS